MKANAFPAALETLEKFSGRFEAHRLKSEKVDVYFAEYPANSSIAEHSHDTDNHGIITKGALYLTVGGKERRYGVGEWYHVPKNVPHSARFEEASAEIELWFKH